MWILIFFFLSGCTTMRQMLSLDDSKVESQRNLECQYIERPFGFDPWVWTESGGWQRAKKICYKDLNRDFR